MVARRADVVRPGPDAKGRLGRDNHFVPTPFDRLAQDFFRHARRVRVGRVKHGQTSVHANVDKPGGLGCIGLAESFERALAAEGAGSETQEGNLESRSAELSMFHGSYASRGGDQKVRRTVEGTHHSRNVPYWVYVSPRQNRNRLTGDGNSVATVGKATKNRRLLDDYSS